MTELKLKIVTPDRVFFDDEIISFTARGIEGDFTILKNHAPFVTVLDIRKIKIKTKEGEKTATVAGGYIIVRDNNITVMSDACEWTDEIDMARAQRAKDMAEKKLRESKSEDDTFKAELALRKAINRLGSND